VLLLWVIFIFTVVALLLLDIGLLHRRVTQLSFLEAIALSGFWIVIGLAFAVLVYFAYEQAWLADYIPVTELSGKQAVIQYLTTYLLEKSLSLDNLFVIAMILQTLNIPLHFQHRVLFYGIAFAILMRTIIIIAGIQLMEMYSWMNYLLAILLLFAAFRLFINHIRVKQRANNKLVNFITRYLPLDETVAHGRFFTRNKKTLMVTPLFIAMLMIESADLVFAIDSIPAVLSISQDAFIVVSSNIFAILGLRALYFLVASAMQQLHYLKMSLIIILLLAATKMFLLHTYSIEPALSLLIVSLVLVTGILVSLTRKDREPLFATSPIAAEMGRIYNLTFAGLRRIIILVLGISVVIVGIIMIVTPGPAIVVIPAGLAILATEFVWARIILKKFKHKFVHYSKETINLFSRNKQTDNTDRKNQ
jgi:tellurite resistance protein TerC